MPQWHGNIRKRKRTGGVRHRFRGKRAFEMGTDPSETVVGDPRIALKRGRGGNPKLRALSLKTANVTNPSTGESKKVEIRRVIRNPANLDYQRRGVITKGAVLDTEMGEAVVTSRPGQQGVVNAVLRSVKSKEA